MAKLKRHLVWGSVIGVALVIVALVVFRMATLSLGPFDRPRQPEDVGSDTAEAHLIGKLPYIRTTDRGLYEAYVTVDTLGNVTKVQVSGARGETKREVLKTVTALKFRPFVRNGRSSVTRFYLPVWALPPERERKGNRKFPTGNLSSVAITLERTGCFGRCPIYRVAVTGSGSVQYEGVWYVSAKGRRERRIAPERVAALVREFEQADFFNLDDRYISGGTDGPTACLTITVAGQTKRVVDYYGLEAGMPLVVLDLEEATVRAAGVEEWAAQNDEAPPTDTTAFEAFNPGGCGLRPDGGDYAGGGGDR